MQQLSNISMQCLQRIIIVFHVRPSCTYGISFDPPDNPRGTQGSYYEPFTNEKIKAQKAVIYSKAPSQKVRSKGSNQVFLYGNQHPRPTCLLGPAPYVRMEGNHHPYVIKKTHKKAFLPISLRIPTISTPTTSTLLISKLFSPLSLTFSESIPEFLTI